MLVRSLEFLNSALQSCVVVFVLFLNAFAYDFSAFLLNLRITPGVKELVSCKCTMPYISLL